MMKHGCGCKHKWMGHGGHLHGGMMGGSCGMGHRHGPPVGALLMLGSMVVSSIASVCLGWRLVRALELLATIKALDTMDARLSDVEKAQLEGHIREELLP